MEISGHALFHPTSVGRQDCEEATSGGSRLQWSPTGLSQGRLNFLNPEIEAPTDFVYDLLKLQKVLKLEITEQNLIQHIVNRLEPQVLDYVEVRNPNNRAQLLQVISNFEERYSVRETQSSNSNNSERRDWDSRWRSPDDHRIRNWRDVEVFDRQNGRRDTDKNA
ncbi:uncharacterized protein TNCV_5033501 [Trichonephila clavipes]|nr:uncharacterized protein TNCV_5033501 [Trichonephila clavipes]